MTTKRSRKISMYSRNRVLHRQNYKCALCNIPIFHFSNSKYKLFDIDHKIPFTFCQHNEEWNLQALCCDCHANKSRTELKTVRRIQEIMSRNKRNCYCFDCHIVFSSFFKSEHQDHSFYSNGNL